MITEEGETTRPVEVPPSPHFLVLHMADEDSWQKSPGDGSDHRVCRQSLFETPLVLGRVAMASEVFSKKLR